MSENVTVFFATEEKESTEGTEERKIKADEARMDTNEHEFKRFDVIYSFVRQVVYWKILVKLRRGRWPGLRVTMSLRIC